MNDNTPGVLQARFPYMFPLEGDERRRAVSEGLMDAGAPFRAFGVGIGSHLAWPLDGRGPK